MSLFQPKALELPFEVIDMIINWLHRRGDLLSLALSHSKFYQAIVPDHLHYRQVDFCISDYAMWSHLLEDSHRLAKLEVLNLSARFQPRSPPIKNPSVDDHEQDMLDHAAKVDSDLIQNAFKGMRRLHTVVWNSDTPLEGTSRAMSLPMYMWEAIHRYCPTVQKVDVLGNFNCWRCFSPNVSEPKCSLENLSGISAFTYQARCFRHIWSGNTFFSFLSSFQRLRHLTLLRPSLWAPSIPYILAMKFPLLESLTVNDYLHVTSTVILEFLAAHPLLHTLNWSTHRGKVTDDSNTDITADTVAPHLKILDSPPDLVQLLFRPSSNVLGSRRSLRSLCTSLPLDTEGPPEDIALLSRVGSGLEELTVGDGVETIKWRCPDLGDALRIISSAFPNLRLLDFGSVCIINYRTPTGTPRPKVHDWMSALSGLSYLVVLTIPWSQAEKNGFMIRASPSKRRHQTMKHFLIQCPRLRFLFFQQSEVLVPRQEVAILIGHRDIDVRFRNGRLIDAGANEDRMWTAYEGKRSHLADEISIALNARHGDI